MSDVPAPALVPSEAQAAMIAKICACLPLPPLAMRVKKDAKDVSYQSQSGSTANSHDVIAQLMLQAVMVGSKEQNTRRQQIQQDVISALTKDLRLVDAEQAYPVFARYTMRYIQSFVVCGERTAAEMDRLAPKADFLDAEVVERDDPVHIACCHWTASQDAFYKDVYGPGEGLDRFIEDPEALAAFEAIRPDPRKMPPAEIMLRAAEAYCESTSYPALISRAHDRILREAERVEKNRKEAGLDCKNLAEDICNEDTETNSDPPKGDEQETDEMKVTRRFVSSLFGGNPEQKLT